MRDEQRFEIERAYDLLPHVVGASWATVWFRLNGIKKPTEEEFREKVVEFFSITNPLCDVYPNKEEFKEIINYIEKRHNEEIKKVKEGLNDEIEKRYKRYLDYG